MIWDRLPRAVAPSLYVESAPAPIPASELLGLSSPLPFGIGIYVAHEDGLEKPIPLVYVPQKAANARGQGVLSGWYAVAIPGSTFSVRITNTTEQGQDILVHGNPVKRGRAVGAELWVDSVNALGDGRYKMADPCREKSVCGFVVGRNYEHGSVFGTKRVVPFKFSRAFATEDIGGGAGPDNGAGTVAIRVFEGDLCRSTQVPPRTPQVPNALPAALLIDEKVVAKAGCAVGVARDGPQMAVQSSVSEFYIDPRNRIHHGSVVIHLREPRWLMQKGILDATARVIRCNPELKPRPRLQASRRSKRTRICDVIDLTPVNGVIDLTGD